VGVRLGVNWETGRSYSHLSHLSPTLSPTTNFFLFLYYPSSPTYSGVSGKSAHQERICWTHNQ